MQGRPRPSKLDVAPRQPLQTGGKLVCGNARGLQTIVVEPIRINPRLLSPYSSTNEAKSSLRVVEVEIPVSIGSINKLPFPCVTFRRQRFADQCVTRLNNNHTPILWPPGCIKTRYQTWTKQQQLSRSLPSRTLLKI